MEATMKKEKKGSDVEWQQLPLGEVFKPNRPRVSPAEKPKLPFIGMEHVEAHTMKLLGTVPAASMKSSSVHFQPGDVLYGRLRPYLNKVYRPDFEGLCSAEFIVFPETKGVDSKYLQYFLNSNDFVAFASHLNEGDRPRVDFKQISPYPFPLAPLPEQRRIVQAIETQLRRLDAAVARLQAAKARLKRYKQAVLKAAVEGELVELEVRLSRGSKFQHASELLKIKDDYIEGQKRRAGRMWGSGHVPNLTDEERDRLPEGWAWTKVRALGYSLEDAVQVGPMSMKSEDFRDDGTPVLNVGCVKWGEFDESKLNYLPEEKASEFDRYRIKQGDVLFTRSGTVGRCAVAQAHQDGWLMTFHLLRARTNPKKCLPDYLRTVFEGAPHIIRQTKDASIGSTRAGFNTNLLAELDVPLPPMREQVRIVAAVEQSMERVREMDSTLDAQLLQAGRLRQAVLKRAFEGRLV